MSIRIECKSGGKKGVKVKVHSFECVKMKRKTGGWTYQIRGESTECPHVLTRFCKKEFAEDWSKSTGKKIAIHTPSNKSKKERAARTARRKARKEKAKAKAKAKAKKEKERARKAAKK